MVEPILKAYACSMCRKVFLSNTVTVTIGSAKNKRGRIAWGRDAVCDDCVKRERTGGGTDGRNR